MLDVRYTVRYNDELKQDEWFDWENDCWVAYHEEEQDAVAHENRGNHIVYKGQETLYHTAQITNILYLNEDGEYAYVPADFLATCGLVRAKIDEVRQVFPEWTDEVEIVMVLQIAGFHVPTVCMYVGRWRGWAEWDLSRVLDYFEVYLASSQ